MPTIPKVKRRWINYVIDPIFQFRMALQVVAIVIVLTAAVLAYAYLRLQETVALLLELSEIPDTTAELLQSETQSFMLGLVGILAVFVIAVTAVVIVQTHRVAGAKYAVLRFVREELLSMRLKGSLVLRKHDYLKDVAETLNELAAKLRSR